MRPVRIGCSGWNYDHWRNGVFYPPRLRPSRWLEHYARHFDTVEVNATFYRLPTVKSVQGWVQGSPPGFVFAVKASRYLTHSKRLTDVGPGLETFYERIRPLVESTKLGPSSGSSPRPFTETTSAWQPRLRHFLPAGIASSSATRAGSSTRSTSCSAATVLRS